MPARTRSPYEVVPTSVLGIIIGTHIINRADDQDEEERPLGGYFGFIPNELFRKVLQDSCEEILQGLDSANTQFSYRDEWSFNINNESGGITFIPDGEESNLDLRDFRSTGPNWKIIFD
jgi:hypothetical protein